jgi:DNA-binding response OmpR family regulator
MSRILIIEDDRDIAELVAHALRKAGHEADLLASGDEALQRARALRPDVIVLDLMLPGVDGLDVCRALRANGDTASIPIIILTARGDESDRVTGLELGADDYVTKPFSPRELAARVSALLRRAQLPAVSSDILRYRGIVIDADRHVVTVDGTPVTLTAKEFLLLQYLVQRKGRVVSRDQLLTDVWGYQYTGGTRTVDVHVRRLREKVPVLNEALETVKQFGYRLAE